jgi:DNA ligase (NAD+)
MNVKYISEGIVTKLVDNGYDSIQKIVKAKPEQLEKIEGLGETIVTKIIENLTESFKISTLSQLMAASTQFGRGLGTKKLKIITKAYPNIMNDKFTKKELKEKIMLLEGFDDITADQFVDHFDEFKKFFDELEKIAPIAHLRQPSKINKNIGNLSGKKIVFTGFRDKALEEKIEKEGGQNSGSVSKNTNIVIYADTTGAKYKKAVELGITVMTPDEFKNTYFK